MYQLTGQVGSIHYPAGAEAYLLTGQIGSIHYPAVAEAYTC
jgi:hypothetical protein